MFLNQRVGDEREVGRNKNRESIYFNYIVKWLDSSTSTKAMKLGDKCWEKKARVKLDHVN